MTKTCIKCNEEKAVEEFAKRKDTKDGHINRCYECCRERQREYYEKNKEKLIAYQKQWSDENISKEQRNQYRKKYKQSPKGKETERRKRQRRLSTPLGREKERIKKREQRKRSNHKENGRWRYYKKSAKKRGLEFSLPREEFSTFWQKPCSFCGDPIETIGLDRIDSSKGYISGNCQPCCTTCNVMKWTQTEEEFLEHCKRIIAFCAQKNQ